jgi:hypothetical protein
MDSTDVATNRSRVVCSPCASLAPNLEYEQGTLIVQIRTRTRYTQRLFQWVMIRVGDVSWEGQRRPEHNDMGMTRIAASPLRNADP